MEPFFLPDGNGGRRLCLHHAPAAAARHAIVYVHPFAEEMNKSRRMAAQQSRSFARAGVAVLQIDLLGCGDSSGDFGDASWQAWVDDVLRGCRWLAERHPGAPMALWGLRAGALIAVQAAARLDAVRRLLLWQPALSGRAVLHQFLRLKAAGDLLGGGGRGALPALAAELEGGNTVEVAGYRVSSALAAGLGAARLDPAGRSMTLAWFELSTREDATLAPASQAVIDAWRAAGHLVQSAVVAGSAFWQSAEIEEAPGLIDASTACFSHA